MRGGFGQVSRYLDAHSAIGLAFGMILYLICLTGSLCVFAFEFERWEQPSIQEDILYKPTAIQRSVDEVLASGDKAADVMYIVLPTESLPRMHILVDDSEYFILEDGSLGAEVVHGWTHFLREVHMHLLLPEIYGVIVVSIFGVVLLALIFSGILSHPTIFRDAFVLRLGGPRRLEQADIHNRLSVWGLPFHIMIAITGAIFGMVSILVVIAAEAFYGGDREAVVEDVYGSDPVIEADIQAVNLSRSFAYINQQFPEAMPIYVALHKLNTRQQFVEIAATLPHRLVYSEIYRFTANGEFIDSQNLADGPLSRQIIYSIYRLHYGQFGGAIVRVAYFFMGMGLTIIVVSGVNIWLSRRSRYRWQHKVWSACVWGVPVVLVLSAITSVIFAFPPEVGAIMALFYVTIMGFIQQDTKTYQHQLKMTASCLCFLLFVGYSLLFPSHLFKAPFVWINISLVAATLGFLNVKRLFLPLSAVVKH